MGKVTKVEYVVGVCLDGVITCAHILEEQDKKYLKYKNKKQ